MTANLTTLSEKRWKGGHRCEGVYIFMHVWLRICVCCSCGRQFKGQAWEKKGTSKRGIVASYPLNSRSPTQGCFTWGNAAEDNYRLDTLLYSLSHILWRLVKQFKDNTTSPLYHPGDSEGQRFSCHTKGCVTAGEAEKKQKKNEKEVSSQHQLALHHFDIHTASLFSLDVCVVTGSI